MSDPRFPNAPRPEIPKAVRDAVFAGAGAVCRYCEATASEEIDHVHPWSAGGSSEITNLVASCAVCNRLAGDRVFGEFAAKRDWIRRCRKALGPKRIGLIERALIAGDTAGAMREMER